MKIAVCGKGGSGKSTVTALLARELAQRGAAVLVVDSDESNYGLHRQLGMELPPDFTAYFGGKQRVLEDLMASQLPPEARAALKSFSQLYFDSPWHLSDIPREYRTERDGVTLMSSGKIHEANEGCACAMNHVLTQFISHLELGPEEYAFVDMEAGLEHFGRGVDNGVDCVLMVVEPSFESLRLSGKILDLGRSIGKPVYFVLNKAEPALERTMLEGVADRALVLGVVPADPQVAQAGLLGQALTGGNPAIAALADRLEKAGRE